MFKKLLVAGLASISLFGISYNMVSATEVALPEPKMYTPTIWGSHTETQYRYFSSHYDAPKTIYYENNQGQSGTLKLIKLVWDSYTGKWKGTYRGTVSGYI